MPTAIIFQPLQLAGAHQSLAVAAVTTVPLPSGANAVVIQATGQNVRITLDGSNPTASRGFQLQPVMGQILLAMQPGSPPILAIQETATATLEVQGVIQAFA